MKAGSEMGELFDAELKNDLPMIKDGVGDVLVCLINYCALKDINMVDCLKDAYNEIKDRKGTLMPDGTFVKESK
jgi:NTP pyrophosphatase (non-canonical NTP hydrolase)